MMKVTPKENLTVMAKMPPEETISVELKSRQKWECRQNSIFKDRYVVSRNGVSMNLSEECFNMWFKETK